METNSGKINDEIPEGYRKAVTIILRAMRRFMEDGSELCGIAFLGKGDCAPVPIPMNMATEKNKDISAEFIRHIVKETGAEYVIMVSEGWTLPKETPIEESKKLIEEYGQISDCPQRQEIVFLTLETPAGSWIGMSPIKALGGVKRGFDDMKFIYTHMQGRFSNFLSAQVH